MENNSTFKVLAVIVLLVVSNFISWNIGKNGNTSISAGAGTFPAIPGGIRNVGGIVGEVSSSSFTLNISSSPYTTKGPSVRTVSVTADTVIERLTLKSIAILQKEQTAFLEQLKKEQGIGIATTTDASKRLTPPDSFTRETISLKDIKAGDMVSVSANEDISTTKQFTATRVSLQVRPQ